LAQGEYISPERLENIYVIHPAVGTIFVHGDSDQTCLVAIIGTDPEPFAAWASRVLRRDVPVSDIKSVYADPQIHKTLLKELDHIAQKRKLSGFERIRAVLLESDPFTVENDLLTPTLKLKRSDAAKAFRSQINLLYREIMAQGEKAKL
jgi:long-chain acyl-CoA synthetase